MWLRQSTASQEILLGPFPDSTDGDTAETGLTIANTDIKLWKEGATTEANKNSGGGTHIASGRYYAVLDATDSNTLGKLEVNVHVAGALAVRREFMVVPANVYDSLVLGTDELTADVVQWLGTAVATPTTAGVPEVELARISGQTVTAAAAVTINAEVGASATAMDAFEDQYDGTGLTGDTYPATQLQGSKIVSVGAATNVPAESYTLTTGTQSANTYTSTAPLDGTRHEHTDTAGAMELYYQFDIGIHGTPTGATLTGYMTGGNDAIGVYAYNWAGTSWDQIGTLQGGAASDSTLTYALYTSHVGTGANNGKVRIRFYEASGLTTATLAVDQLFTSYATVPEIAHIDGAISDVSPTTTDFDTDLTQATGFWDDALLYFTSGALEGQSRTITAYVTTNGNITFDEATTSAPANGDTFIIEYSHIHPVTQIQSGLATEAKQDIIDANVDNLVLGIVFGAAATGTLSTTQATSDLTGYTNDQMIGRIITVTSGNAEGESSAITDYVETNGLLTFDLMTLPMANGNTFKIT